MKEESDNTVHKEIKLKSFKRMSVWERGHFSNIFSINPVQSIAVSPEKLRIKKRFSKERKYTWKEINKAYIERKQAYKSYGAGTGAKYIQSTLHLLIAGDEYLIDVSSNCPDFMGSKKMLSELSKYLSIQEL